MKQEDVRALVHYRVEQAEEALADAQGLLTINRSPRSVINRSYYAMFYAATALLQSVDKSAAKHHGLLSLFDLEFVHTGLFDPQFSRDLHRAFDLRQVSDYKLVRSPDVATANEIFSKAQRFVDAVKTFLTEQGWINP